jgi:NADH-quinone oxidoreductase subunit N
MLTHALAALRNFMHTDGVLLLPELELLLFAIGILVMDRWITAKEKYWSPALALAGTFFSASILWMLRGRIIPSGTLVGVQETMIVDPYFIFFAALFLAATALITLLSINHPNSANARQGRYYAVLLLACVAMMFLVASVDLLLNFLALEALALSSYLLLATAGPPNKPAPPAINYVLSSAFGSALIAYAFSLLYGLGGSTNLGKIAVALNRRHSIAGALALTRQPGGHGNQMYELLRSRLPEVLNVHPYVLQALSTTAAILILLGIGLKFYASSLRSPRSPATALITTPLALFIAGPCAAALVAFLVRVLVVVLTDSEIVWSHLIAVLGIVLLLCGTIASLRERSPSRILQTASIAQIGNVMLALVAANETAFTGITYYLFAYLFILAGSSAALQVSQSNLLARGDFAPDSSLEIDGLRHRSPVTAFLLIIFILALAGFPPTAGFYARYLIFQSLLETGHRYLAWAAALRALPLAYSYLRIAVMAWRKTPAPLESDTRANSDPDTEIAVAPKNTFAPVSFGAPEAIVLGICIFVSLAAGLYAEPFTRMARYAFGQ